jgi:hypothetical protein
MPNRSDLLEGDITKPIHEEKYQNFDWQRAQEAKDRCVIDSQVKNAISLYLKAYSQSVDAFVAVLKRIPNMAPLFVCNDPEASTNMVTLLHTVVCVWQLQLQGGNLAQHDIIHQVRYCDK